MFRNRTNSQKPTDELYASFRSNFPTVVPQTSTAQPGRSMSLSDALTDPTELRQSHQPMSEIEEIKDHDPTPKGQQEQWRLTPSLLDPNSFAFASFANQPPGYYTPTPGGMNTLYHSQAGDLHTPSMGIGLGTPSSLPISESGVHVDSTIDMHDFSQATLHSHHFHDYNPFGSQQTFAPSQFVHQSTGFEPMDASGDASPMHDMGMDAEMHLQSPQMSFAPRNAGPAGNPTLRSLEEYAFSSPETLSLSPSKLYSPGFNRFRYHVTLNAPTAMIKHSDEIPITYLNKGQAYSMTVKDNSPSPFEGEPFQYRTFVRVSFEDEQQRQRPAACWQLWKEGRGTNEAHQRGGKLQAVEYVDPTATGEDTNRSPQVQVESASFDGFSVLWTPSGDQRECTFAVRFNFLSTDFSHSKGVKGIPVRLCAKTEAIPNNSPETARTAEVCFCKVKLFRDHGAERKLSNDVAHVKKTIEKLKQQIAQAEAGSKDFGKRKRSGSMAKMSASTRPGKVPKHKRTWSMSSTSSGGGTGRTSAEDDLHSKLATIQDMFTSTRPNSIFFLRGQEQDDPDLHPVQLVGDTHEIAKLEIKDPAYDRRESGDTSHAASVSSMVSPSSSTGRQASALHSPPQAPPPPMTDWTPFQSMAPVDLQSSNPQKLASPPDQPIKIQRVQPGGPQGPHGWIEALDVDPSYKPPPEKPVKPVACVYVLQQANWRSGDHQIYRAVYLKQRTSSDLIAGIAAKYNIESSQVQRAVHVNSKGLNIFLDDDVVRQIPEGQDMILDLSEIKPKRTTTKREWDSGATDVQIDGDFGIVDSGSQAQLSDLELKLIF